MKVTFPRNSYGEFARNVLNIVEPAPEHPGHEPYVQKLAKKCGVSEEIASDWFFQGLYPIDCRSPAATELSISRFASKYGLPASPHYLGDISVLVHWGDRLQRLAEPYYKLGHPHASLTQLSFYLTGPLPALDAHYVDGEFWVNADNAFLLRDVLPDYILKLLSATFQYHSSHVKYKAAIDKAFQAQEHTNAPVDN